MYCMISLLTALTVCMDSITIIVLDHHDIFCFNFVSSFHGYIAGMACKTVNAKVS